MSMEPYERVQLLRKKYLNMSQEDFAGKLGVSRSVIKNIEYNLLARPEMKIPLLKQICTEFNVNEEWLFNGTGPIYKGIGESSLKAFISAKGIDEDEMGILNDYFELGTDTRHAIMSDIRRLVIAAKKSDYEKGGNNYG